MIEPLEHSAEEARRAALHVSWVAAMNGLLVVALLEWKELPPWPWIVSGAVGAAGIGLVLIAPRLSRLASLAVLTFETVVSAVAMWITVETVAASGHPFVPFSGYKILALVLALFCPSLGLGAALIGLTALQATVQTLLWSEDVRSRMPALEPWMTVTICLIALGLLVSRRRHAALQEELAHAQAKQSWLERVARFSLFVRDLTNSPLQTLRFGASLVRQQHAVTGPIVDRMENAIVRWAQLNDSLAPLDRLVRWRSEDVSFDALTMLDREVRDHIVDGEGTPEQSAPGPELQAAEEARRATLYLALILVGAGVMIIPLLAWKSYPTWGFALLWAIALATLGTTLAVPRLPRRFSLMLFAALSIGAIMVVLSNNDQMAQRGHPFDAFAGLKLIPLLVALLCPSGRVGAALIGIGILAPVVESYVWWSAGVRSQLLVLEPWPTVFIGLAALGVLAARRHHVAAVRELARTQARASSLARLARIAVSVRDLTNSPLQTLTASAALLRTTTPGSGPVVEQMERALARLHRLNEALSPLGASITPESGEISLDASSRIKEEVRSTLADAGSV